MLRVYPLLEWHIHLIEYLLLGPVVEPLIPNPIAPMGEVRVNVTELLVVRILHGLHGYMDVLASHCGCLLPLSGLLMSGELGWSSLLKLFLDLIHMTLASLLGTTWRRNQYDRNDE
jgi:hypothetical protein